MPNPNVQFLGNTLIIPGAYYSDNVSAAIPAVAPTTPPLIFIGYGYGQKPQTAMTYANPNDFINAMRGGPCAAFAPFLTFPSTQLPGAQLFTFINVGENTQSTASLFAGVSGLGVATSTNYGTPSNLLQYQVQTGTIAGKKLTLFDGFANAQVIGDNLGVPFVVAYTGAATGGVTYTVTTSGLVATQFAVNSPNSGESFTIQLGSGQYTNAEAIVNYLNGTGFYASYAIGDGTLPSNYLDTASGVALPSQSGGVNQYVNISASLGAVVYFFNQYAQAFATFAVSGTVLSYTSGLAPSNTALTSFTGARSIPPVNADYASGFNVALTVPGWTVFCDSNTAAVQALLGQHVNTASSVPYGKWRRGFTGSNVGDSVATTIQNAQNLDSFEMVYAYPGIFRTNTITGLNQLYGGLYAAAAAASMANGGLIASPLTNKALVANGVELQLTVSQINQLQQAGVMPIALSQTTGIATIISDMTTWQLDSNPENIFSQQIACRFWVAYSMVNALQPYVGTIADVYDETRILNAAKVCLNSLIYQPGNNGVISSWQSNSLVLNYSGATQTAAITVNVTLVGQNRFITVYVPIQPLNLTITAAAA